MIIFILLRLTESQPCTTRISILTTPTQNNCTTNITTPINSTLTTLTTVNEYTVSGWFSLDDQNNTYSLFRVTTNPTDTSGSTSTGIRASFVIQGTSTKLQYSTTSLQSTTATFNFIIKKWFFAAISVSHTQGKINGFLWQPQQNLKVIIPITLSANFNTALGPTTLIDVLYWGTYTAYCGQADLVYFYSYFEADTTTNWINLAYFTSADSGYHFRLEDQIGQMAYSGQVYGYLGQSKTVDPADPTPGYSVVFNSAQYITLPFMAIGGQMQFSFWFFTNLVILSDADSADAVQDVILYRRVYAGSQDQLVIYAIQNGANFQLKIKLQSQFVTFPTIITASTWTLITVALAYPQSVHGMTKIYYDVNIGATNLQAQTTYSFTYQESPNDLIYLGDSRNQLTNSFKLNNFRIFKTYTKYRNPTACIPNCVLSSNSDTYKTCIQCSNKEQDGSCVATCLQGPVGLASAAPNICSQCNYKCATCLGANCYTCNQGYYLSGTNCVIASGCAPQLANPISNKCNLCGNGAIDAGETCDDGNFLDMDGCTNCAIDTGFTCTGAPSVCLSKCGNSVLDAGEQCDTGSKIVNGCKACQLEVGYECTGINCNLLCGNGKRLQEDCDDGNLINGDGCSQCKVDFGYVCTGGTSTTVDTCTNQCPNSIINQNEECDDGNNITTDGCYQCRVQIGWTCSSGSCVSLCGNSVLDSYEQCDDGNQTSGDGCSNTCQIEWGYKCPANVCAAVPSVCGDGYKLIAEACDDSNVVDGDGCSAACLVESGYTCIQTPYQYSKSICTKPCSGTSCPTIPVCGDGFRDLLEQCDDGNQIQFDGCTDCTIDGGYNCQYIVGGFTDICVQCPDNCLECGNKCNLCYVGFVLYKDQCVSQCPQNYYQQGYTCQSCPSGCQDCQGSLCLTCTLSYFLINQQCLTQCPDGYFEQQNGVLGNSCTLCFYPCSLCTSATTCYGCAEKYQIKLGSCLECNLDTNCIHCQDQQCTECIVGYKPEGAKCVLINPQCGDGLHALSESCDNANANEGCKDCIIQSGWNCVLIKNEGPDICYTLQALNFTTTIDEIHFDSLYVNFNRPLAQYYNFSNLLKVQIPNTIYTYSYSLLDLQKLKITFKFNQTIQNTYCYLNFTSPNEVIDMFGWSLVGLASTSQLGAFGLHRANLNYYIHYDTDEIRFANTLSYIILSFGLIAITSALFYNAKIGGGQVWSIMYTMQLMSTMRLINMRYTIHIYYVLGILNLANLSFIFNVFQFDQGPQSTTPKFILDSYSQEFLLNAGGRFISAIIYLIGFWIVVKSLIRFVTWEPLLNRLEDIAEYMKFQLFVRLLEVMFFDLFISVIQTFLGFNSNIQIASAVFAIIYLLLIIAAFVLLYIFVIRHDDAVKFEWLHRYLNCLYDGYNLRIKLGRFFIYSFYVIKFAQSFAFLSTDPFIQILILCVFRVIMFPPLFKYNPFVSRLLLFRQTSQAVIDCLTMITFLSFRADSDTKTQKVSSGWVVFMALLINLIHYTMWNVIFLFLKFQAPNYLVEEAEAELNINDDLVLKRKKERLKEQKEFGNVQQEDPDEIDEKQPVSNIKSNQIAPVDYVEPVNVKNSQIAPVDYVEPLNIKSSQIAPMSSESQRPRSALMSNKQADKKSLMSQLPVEQKDDKSIIKEYNEQPSQLQKSIINNQLNVSQAQKSVIQQSQREIQKPQKVDTEGPKKDDVDDFFS